VIDVAARLLTGTIRRVSLAGGANRLGGLLAGAVLALLGIRLLTTCLLLLPASLLPFASSAYHSEMVRLLESVPPQWSQSLRTHLESLGVEHPTHGRRRDSPAWRLGLAGDWRRQASGATPERPARVTKTAAAS
jgi:hypothetical protein